MAILARVVFSWIEWASRKGLSTADVNDSHGAKSAAVAKVQARRTGVRGETFAYWYLRCQGYTMVARNFTASGMKGEIDLVGYDGAVLAFIEVKTRTGAPATYGLPEDAVTPEKRRNLSRMARQFRAERRLREALWRFDVVAIESRPGSRPAVRLHKGAFTDH